MAIACCLLWCYTPRQMRRACRSTIVGKKDAAFAEATAGAGRAVRKLRVYVAGVGDQGCLGHKRTMQAKKSAWRFSMAVPYPSSAQVGRLLLQSLLHYALSLAF